MNIHRNRLSRKERLSYGLYSSIEDNRFSYVTSIVRDPDSDPNWIVPEHGITPLHLAIGHENKVFARDVTLLLLQHCGNPNVRSVDGMTPVHVAAAWGRTQILAMLLSAGGDPWLKDDDGKNAFQYADEENRWRASKLLERCREIDPRYTFVLDKVFLDEGVELEFHTIPAPALLCQAVATQTSPRRQIHERCLMSEEANQERRDWPQETKGICDTLPLHRVFGTEDVYQYSPSLLSEGEVKYQHSSSVTLVDDWIYETHRQIPQSIEEDNLGYHYQSYLYGLRAEDVVEYSSHEHLPRPRAEEDLGYESFQHYPHPRTRRTTGIDLPNLMSEIAAAALRNHELPTYMSEADLGYDNFPSLVTDLAVAALLGYDPPRVTSGAKLKTKNLPSTCINSSQVLPPICSICQPTSKTTNDFLNSLESDGNELAVATAGSGILEATKDASETATREPIDRNKPKCSSKVRVCHENLLDELKDRQVAGLKGASHQLTEAIAMHLVDNEALVDVNLDEVLDSLDDESTLPDLDDELTLPDLDPTLSVDSSGSESDFYESAEGTEIDERRTLVARIRTLLTSDSDASSGEPETRGRKHAYGTQTLSTMRVCLKKMRLLGSRVVYRVSGSSSYHNL